MRNNVYKSNNSNKTTEKDHIKLLKSIVPLIITIMIIAIIGVAVILYIYFTNNDTIPTTPTIHTSSNTSNGETITNDKKNKIYTYVNEDMINYVISNDSNKLIYQTIENSLFLITTENETPFLIAENVLNSKFILSSNGENLAYIKNDNNLYSYDFTNEKKVLDDTIIELKNVNDDLFFLTPQGFDIASNPTFDLYTYNLNKSSDGSFKIASQVHNQFYTSDSSSVFYTKITDKYLNENIVDVYKYLSPTDNNLILEDISINNIDVNNEIIYYHKKNDTVIDLSKYIEDDLEDFDNSIEMPPDYATFAKEHGGTEEEIDKAYTKAFEEYFYKIGREETRENVDIDSNLNLFDLYLYENGESKLIVKDVYKIYDTDFLTQTVVYANLNLDKIPIVTIEDLDKVFWRSLQNYIEATSEFTILATLENNETFELIDVKLNKEFTENISYILPNKTGVYVLSSEFTDQTFLDLYYFDFNDKENAKFVIENVNKIFDFDTQNILFTTNVNGTLTLYTATKTSPVKLTENVDINTFKKHNESVLYFANYNNELKQGDLYIYNGEKATLISTGVKNYTFTSEKEIYITKDKLYKYNGSSLELVDN